ncbi:acyl-CoA dehydrogenase family protein [Streptomyces decoyicus]|uniref:acyl-CoA dehydrogenase family protein n=1 Tax=Streptomyces decoyicus TaxID=249567 RepID=UPI0033C3F9C3
MRAPGTWPSYGRCDGPSRFAESSHGPRACGGSLIAACSLGGRRAALDGSLVHLADREAFDGRLLDAQALRFRLAGMATEPAAARALVHSTRPHTHWTAATRTPRSGARWPSGSPPTPATRSPTAPLQLHGGYGYLTEYGIEEALRDLRVHQIISRSVPHKASPFRAHRVRRIRGHPQGPSWSAQEAQSDLTVDIADVGVRQTPSRQPRCHRRTWKKRPGSTSRSGPRRDRSAGRPVPAGGVLLPRRGRVARQSAP